MRTCATICAVGWLVTVPASAEDLGLVIDLLPGHPVYHEAAGEAGAVMAIAITPDEDTTSDLRGLCEELRVAARLRREHAEGLPLEVIFVVPYKEMAIEGYYLPTDTKAEGEALVAGKGVEREILDGIVARAGIPGWVLDEDDVEQEVSCEIAAPAWLLRWEDVRLVGNEQPDAVIDRAYHRFAAIYQRLVAHATAALSSKDGRIDTALSRAVNRHDGHAGAPIAHQ